MCGLNDLSKEERLARVAQILVDQDWKQDVCNQILGASHKDVERALRDLVKGRAPTKQEEIRREIEEISPEKLYGLPLKHKKAKPSRRDEMQSTFSQGEVNALVNASTTALNVVAREYHTNYPTYTLEDVETMLANNILDT